MKGNDVRSRLCKWLDMCLGMLNHEVHVKDRLGHLAQALHNAGSQGDVRHKRPIHHVDVDVLRTCLLHAAHIRAEVCKVRRKNGRRNDGRTLDVNVLFFHHFLFVLVFMFVCHWVLLFLLCSEFIEQCDVGIVPLA